MGGASLEAGSLRAFQLLSPVNCVACTIGTHNQTAVGAPDHPFSCRPSASAVSHWRFAAEDVLVSVPASNASAGHAWSCHVVQQQDRMLACLPSSQDISTSGNMMVDSSVLSEQGPFSLT